MFCFGIVTIVMININSIRLLILLKCQKANSDRVQQIKTYKLDTSILFSICSQIRSISISFSRTANVIHTFTCLF